MCENQIQAKADFVTDFSIWKTAGSETVQMSHIQRQDSEGLETRATLYLSSQAGVTMSAKTSVRLISNDYFLKGFLIKKFLHSLKLGLNKKKSIFQFFCRFSKYVQ